MLLYTTIYTVCNKSLQQYKVFINNVKGRVQSDCL